MAMNAVYPTVHATATQRPASFKHNCDTCLSDELELSMLHGKRLLVPQEMALRVSSQQEEQFTFAPAVTWTATD